MSQILNVLSHFMFYSLHEAMPHVVKQLRLLWNLKLIKLLFNDLFTYSDIQTHQQEQAQMAAGSKS